MIAVDTNVLLRRLLDDDVVQTERARRLVEGAREVLITDVVLAETIWTLKGKRYKARRETSLLLSGDCWKNTTSYSKAVRRFGRRSTITWTRSRSARPTESEGQISPTH